MSFFQSDNPMWLHVDDAEISRRQSEALSALYEDQRREEWNTYDRDLRRYRRRVRMMWILLAIQLMIGIIKPFDHDNNLSLISWIWGLVIGLSLAGAFTTPVAPWQRRPEPRA